MPSPFCFDDDEQAEIQYHVEDLRDRYQEMQFAADDFQTAISEYNLQVASAIKFLEQKVGDCEDELYNARTEKFQQTPRGKRIAEWIAQLRSVQEGLHSVQLDIAKYVDSDQENLADKLEDLEREA
jgi:hypothetical protein